MQDTIYDEDISITNEVRFNDEWNETEKELYKRLSLITTQMDKAKDKDDVIWVGHSIDILVETIVLHSMEEVS
jgi:hypothetical protein